ncbi:MAG TPA: hypothetical protein PLU36_04240 [Chitinophagaceae bacterium]|nr:hypothetical protein [Chitinophagaceae bacterium]MCC6634356.1 hypothetical protein [Chitinophagaceae bacterium]HMZ45990.1 hypothetical protein [Chitinophagaceae bacterium]HNF29810.1 hypothetical protein [Chitinophagaceae bacterium]HNJ58234.1 hypothetical protein [Chitinophagaceae bacterium]
MDTIFDYNPTEQELVGLFYKTENEYKQNTSNDMIIADLAILFADRNQPQKANEYWAKIPELHQEFLLGFDDVLIPQ